MTSRLTICQILKFVFKKDLIHLLPVILNNEMEWFKFLVSTINFLN